jgi:hypothetical protein
MRVEYYEQCPRCSAIGRDTRGDNVGVYTDGSKHCFSCGWHKHPIGFRQAKEVINDNKALLPADFTWDVPTRGWQWVIQYGLPISYWQLFTGYSPKEERLVFRVGNPLQFSIGRYVGSSVVERPPRKWYVWGKPHDYCTILNGENKESKVILVEDLISAHKVSRVYPAIPLFGTEVYPPVLHYLSHNHPEVILWLDKDQDFHVKRKALRLESLINKPVKIVTTEKDPKCLPLQNIQTLIITL